MEIKEKKSQEIAQNVSIDNLRQNLASTIRYTHPHTFLLDTKDADSYAAGCCARSKRHCTGASTASQRISRL